MVRLRDGLAPYPASILCEALRESTTTRRVDKALVHGATPSLFSGSRAI
jgi:hypothetical protein